MNLNESDQYRDTAYEFIQWLHNTGREFPVNEEPLLQAIFTKIRMESSEINQFGLKLLQFKGRLETVDVFEVAQTIIKFIEPYKQEWKAFDHLPQNLKAIARRYYVIDFLVESLLTLDFSKKNLRETWHDVIYTTLNQYLGLTESIRRLGVFYWKKFFENRFIKDVPPLLNYYKDLFLDELQTVLSSPSSENKGTDILLMANNLMDIWNIYYRYNIITNDPLLLPMDWISETLYKIIVPSIQDDIAFTTNLPPEKIDAFINQPIEAFENFSEEEKSSIAQFKADFAYSIALKNSKIAITQLKNSNVIASLISSSWCLYYFLLASKEKDEYLIHSKDFWTEFYDGVRVLEKHEELIVIHYSILAKVVKGKNQAFQILDYLFESLSLLDIINEKEISSTERKNLQELQKTIIGIKGFIHYPKEIFAMFIPLLKPLAEKTVTRMQEPIKTILINAFSHFETSKIQKIFSEKELVTMRIIDQYNDQIGLLVPTKTIDEKLDTILTQIGLELDFSSEIQQGQDIKAYSRIYKGWIDPLGFELQLTLNTFDESQTLINWQIGWTKLSEDTNAGMFIFWSKYFLEAILRNSLIDQFKRSNKPINEQVCVNCQEKFRNKPRSQPFYVLCPKCTYPNMPLDL